MIYMACAYIYSMEDKKESYGYYQKPWTLKVMFTT